MPTKLSTGKVRRVYEFIKENRDHYDTKMMCRVLDVTRSGYYAWLLSRFRVELKRTYGSSG
jgi:hypothetical protein